jgi:hypothetical protein
MLVLEVGLGNTGVSNKLLAANTWPQVFGRKPFAANTWPQIFARKPWRDMGFLLVNPSGTAPAGWRHS